MATGLENVLACPECSSDLFLRPYTFTCEGNGRRKPVIYKNVDGVPNLLPTNMGGGGYRGQDASDASFNYRGHSATLDSESVQCLLDDISRGRMREVSEHIVGDVISSGLSRGAYKPDGRLTDEGVHLVAGLFNTILSDYREEISPDALPRLVASVSLARYEAELAASLDYVGNFEMPDELIDRLPNSEGVLAEFAIGNGANLRRLINTGNYDLSFGFDNCLGMIRAARLQSSREILMKNTHIGVADAMYSPLKEDSIDTLVMFNALDRIAEPKKALRELAKKVKRGGTIVLGNCLDLHSSDLQYTITGNGFTLECVPESERFSSIEEAVNYMGAEIIDTGNLGKRIEWNPETILQGWEQLWVDVVMGIKK